MRSTLCPHGAAGSYKWRPGTRESKRVLLQDLHGESSVMLNIVERCGYHNACESHDPWLATSYLGTAAVKAVSLQNDV